VGEPYRARPTDSRARARRARRSVTTGLRGRGAGHGEQRPLRCRSTWRWVRTTPGRPSATRWPWLPSGSCLTAASVVCLWTTRRARAHEERLW